MKQRDKLEVEYSDLTHERIGEVRSLGMDLKSREIGLGEANLGAILYGVLAGLVLGTCVGCVGAGLILRYSFDVTLNRQQIALKTIGFCVAAGCVGGMLGGEAGYKLPRTYILMKMKMNLKENQ